MLATRQLMRPNRGAAMSSGSESESDGSDDDSDDCPPIRKRYRTNDSNNDQSIPGQGACSNPLLNSKKRPNNVWGNVLQEEQMSKSFGGALGGVTKKECTIERDVESYDYNPEEFVTHDYNETSCRNNSPVHDPFEAVIDSHIDEVDLADLENDLESDNLPKAKKRTLKDRLGSISDEQKPKSMKERLGSVEQMDSECSSVNQKKDLREKIFRSDSDRRGGHRRHPRPSYKDYDDVRRLERRDGSHDRRDGSRDRRDNKNLKRRRPERDVQRIVMKELDDSVTPGDSDEKVVDYIADVLQEQKKIIIGKFFLVYLYI